MNQTGIILNEIRGLANKMFGDGRAFVYLYGSRARSNATNDSDWDLLIVTDDAISSKDDFERFAFPFAEIGWKYGEQITPLLYTRSQWEAERGTAFHQNVESEAILI